MKNKPLNRAFTLIEIIVVITIIAILTALALASAKVMREKSRDMRRMTDMRELYKAVIMYKSKTGKLPCTSAGDPLSVDIKTTSNASNNCLIRDLTGSGLMASVPRDPSGASRDNTYPYRYKRDAADPALFYVQATLERGDYRVDTNYTGSNSCAKAGLTTCDTYGYCRIVPYLLGSSCGFVYTLGSK